MGVPNDDFRENPMTKLDDDYRVAPQSLWKRRETIWKRTENTWKALIISGKLRKIDDEWWWLLGGSSNGDRNPGDIVSLRSGLGVTPNIEICVGFRTKKPSFPHDHQWDDPWDDPPSRGYPPPWPVRNHQGSSRRACTTSRSSPKRASVEPPERAELMNQSCSRVDRNSLLDGEKWKLIYIYIF